MCGTCAGLGFLDRVCPECGFDGKSVPLTKQDVTSLVLELEKCNVPRNYFGKNWSSDIFWVSHNNSRGNRLVESYVSQLEKVHEIFSSGQLPNRSVLFLAPSGHSKLTWAYSCMQHALKAGFKVAPMLDTLEIKRLFILSSEMPSRVMTGIDYETYISADVCFFTVIKSEQRRNSFSVIQDLLDKRNRRGLTTVGLSRYSISEISSWDRSGDFRKITVPQPEENLFKVPAIISCL